MSQKNRITVSQSKGKDHHQSSLVVYSNPQA